VREGGAPVASALAVATPAATRFGGDLLSYLFFAPEFIEPLIELGRRDAQAWLDRQGRAGPGARSTRGPPRGLETSRL